MKNIYFLMVCLFLISCRSSEHKTISIQQFLNKTDGIKVVAIASDTTYEQVYELMIRQPLDHFSTTTDSFYQYVVLKHREQDAYVSFETEGYGLSHRFKPLADILAANQIIVEHRFNGQSLPEDDDWNKLTIKQAAADLHHITKIFKKFYTQRWISSGFSKGGQTALFHRRFYPEDVTATVCFDAPLNFEQQDKRIDNFFDTISTPECRQKLIDVQRAILKQKDKILPMLKDHADNNGLGYEKSGIEGFLEYAVLEYPFSFWQYSGLSCDSIPSANAPFYSLFQHLIDIVGLFWLSDDAYNSPSMYQFHTELGYYGYLTKRVEDLLTIAPLTANNLQFSPLSDQVIFDTNAMQDINEWLQTKGDNIIFIYGSNDPWSATRVQLSNKTNALTIVKEGGNHLTMIENLPLRQRQKVLQTLEKWLMEGI